MKVVDLTLPIGKHWRYALEQKLVRTFADGSRTQATSFALQTHWYTHIDAPRHFLADGPTLDKFPLDLLIGEARILDLSDVGDNEAITADRLRKALGNGPSRDIVLLKTCRGGKTAWTSTDFWDSSPYVTDDAAIWLRELGPKVVGFDFPQDRDTRLLRSKSEHDLEFTTHEHLLKKGVLMIEYLHNMWSLGDRDLIRFVGLPLNLSDADGAPIRAVAVMDE